MSQTPRHLAVQRLYDKWAAGGKRLEREIRERARQPREAIPPLSPLSKGGWGDSLFTLTRAGDIMAFGKCPALQL